MGRQRLEYSGCGYADRVDVLLRQAERNGHTVLDVFAGRGGISLGFEAAGFRTAGIEADGSCVNTYNHNLQDPNPPDRQHPAFYSAGNPPPRECQPGKATQDRNAPGTHQKGRREQK